MMQWFWSSVRSKNQGISLVEIVLVLAVSAFLFLALASLLLRTSVTKTANENLLTAITLAEDVLERIRKQSIDNFDGLATFIDQNDINDTFTLFFSSESFRTQFYLSETLPEALNRLPKAKDDSYITFTVTQRGASNGIEKISVAVVVRWQEPTGWTKVSEATTRSVQDKEYVLRMDIAKNGLGAFLKQ